MPKDRPAMKEKPFFVGYLDMPPTLKPFYYLFLACLLGGVGVLGYTIAAQQTVTGPATWETKVTTTMQGILVTTPYPVLHRIDPTDENNFNAVLLVNPGKHSAIKLTSHLDRQWVSVNGYQIERGGWTMIELAGPNAISKIEQPPTEALLPIKSLGKISLIGEIVDSKCFLGVMKPGVGKLHKACAEVCLRGGIPPMLVAEDTWNNRFGYLVAKADGSDASTLLSKFAAEPVRINGQLRQQGDLLYIAMEKQGIERL